MVKCHYALPILYERKMRVKPSLGRLSPLLAVENVRRPGLQHSCSPVAPLRIEDVFSTCLQSENTLLLKTMKCCHSCNKELSTGRSTARRDACPSCGADLHCCLNCALYERAASKQCREPAAEQVKEKARANFCDFFLFREKRGAATDAAEARRALDELFKK